MHVIERTDEATMPTGKKTFSHKIEYQIIHYYPHCED